MATAYEILGIKRNATREEIRTAYKDLARRWHPDRFSEGPERMWAEQKMTEINIAYNEALENCQPVKVKKAVSDDEQYADIRRLLEIGQVGAARQALVRIAIRNAEWYYLFGNIFFRQGNNEKALAYYEIAAHKSPYNPIYNTAYLALKQIITTANRKNFIKKLKTIFTGK